MATLTVGPGQQFSTLADAVAASQSGDTIDVQAGTYTNDFAEVTHPLTIEGVNGMANFVVTVEPPNGKGILLVDTDATVSNLSFSGATTPDENGAGIRQQGGNVTLNSDYFFNNQDGVLAATENTTQGSGGNLTVNNSEFSSNGTPDGQAHNLYVDGGMDGLVATGSYFHDAVGGHEIKSRAHSTDISNSRVQDQNGTASYNVDLPNGGTVTISSNVIQQGPNSPNAGIIANGTEGSLFANQSLSVNGNTIVNQLDSPSAVAVQNYTDTVAQITNNTLYGLTADQVASGPAAVSGNVFLSGTPTLDTSHPFAVASAPTTPSISPPSSTGPTQPPLPASAPAPTPNTSDITAISSSPSSSIVQQNQSANTATAFQQDVGTSSGGDVFAQNYANYLAHLPS